MASEHCEKLTRLVTAGAREISLAIGRRLDDEEGMDSVKPPVPAGMAATTGATERRAKGPIARRGKEVS
jgi:hypothetical protein